MMIVSTLAWECQPAYRRRAGRCQRCSCEFSPLRSRRSSSAPKRSPRRACSAGSQRHPQARAIVLGRCGSARCRGDTARRGPRRRRRSSSSSTTRAVLAKRRSSSASRPSSPWPVRAEPSTTSGSARRGLGHGAPPRPPTAGRPCSRTPPGAPRRPDAPGRGSRSTSSTSARCAALSGWAMSRTWITRSAVRTSSSVARNAATRSVGSSAMKPTVSDRIACRPDGRASRAWSGRGSRTAGRGRRPWPRSGG